MMEKISKTLQIQKYVRRKIRDEVFSSNAKLPSERKLAAELHTSQLTVNKALCLLVQEKVLYRIKGTGTFVSEEVVRISQGHTLILMPLHHSRNPMLNVAIMEFERIVRKGNCRVGIQFMSKKHFFDFEAIKRHLPNVIVCFCLSDRGDLPRELRESGCPVLASEVETHDVEGFSVFETDNFSGGKLAAEELLRKAHRRIAILHSSGLISKARCDGFLHALAEHGVKLDPRMLLCIDNRSLRLEDALARLMSYTEKPTAIFCDRDLMALQIIKGLKAVGVCVPDDISVIGFDDIPEASESNPKLTTIRQPMEKRGREMGRMVLDIINGDKERPIMSLYMRPHIVCRESVSATFNGGLNNV